MLGLKRRKPIAEREAGGALDRLYHDLRQTLRTSGVPLNFRVWASYPGLLPILWDALRPNAERRPFEDAADRLRAEAVFAATEVTVEGAALVEPAPETPPVGNGPWEAERAEPAIPDRVPGLRLGPSQELRLRGALDLFNYVDPKLLLLSTAASLALEGQEVGRDEAPGAGELIERGIPERMHPMEMVPEALLEGPTRKVLKEMRRIYSLPALHSDYRALALWPEYLAARWPHLKALARRAGFLEACERLRTLAEGLARALPLRVHLSRERVEASVDDPAEAIASVGRFTRLFPPLLINMAVLGLDWRSAEELSRSPFPAAARGRPPGVEPVHAGRASS